jgi:hypothetical protein
MEFTIEQKSIIDGSLLGDGSIFRPKKPTYNTYFVKTQKASRKKYLDWHFEKLMPWSSRITVRANSCNNGKIYSKCVYTTKAYPCFKSLREKWYPKGVKIVPRDLTLNPLSFAIWYLDDGYNHLKGRTCKISTCGFTKFDCEFLCSIIKKDLGFNFKIRRKSNKYFEIVSVAEEFKAIIELVKPYVLWDFFAYKIAYREPQVKRMSDQEAILIKEGRKKGLKLKELSEQYGYCTSAISGVCNNKTKQKTPPKKSGFKNVYWDRVAEKWKAHKVIDGKGCHLGLFDTPEEAAQMFK